MIQYVIQLHAQTGGSKTYEERDAEAEAEIIRKWHHDYESGIQYMQESFGIKESVRVELWMLGHPAWPGGLMIERLT